jgi:hypothetical protein
MALTKSILRMTETETVFKIAGNGGSATIDLQTDLVDGNQATSGATQTVTILAVRWQGETNNIVAVTRNGTRVLTLVTDQGDYIAFDGQELPPENTAATSDIVVEQVFGTGYFEVYLKLRKVSGYAPKVETAQFSVYDDTNTVGS